ncbi:MAG TPA: pseudouridine synthase [Patescibacteria group bacterium]|nr:pseudouridine synthase [Patescibacteria group bacterium]
MNDTQRLDKYLANLGVCARRAVEDLLKRESLTINGVRAEEPGIRINPDKDKILLNGKEIKKPKLVYYLLNKPKGVISTTSDEKGRKNVTSLIPTSLRLYPVGRLDKDTTGLILLTNDGELTNHLTHPRYEVHKTYKLTINGRVNEKQLSSLRNGVKLEEGLTHPAEVKVVREGDISILEVTIHEGKNRQIRRMCLALGIKLTDLQRIKLGPIEIGNLGVGKYRELTVAELKLLSNK